MVVRVQMGCQIWLKKKDANPGEPEVEDARKRLAGLNR